MSVYFDKDAELVELLRSLIRIPSWVSDDGGKSHNENEVVDFLEGWLKANTNLEVIRQPLPDGRFNLIARKGNPDMVWLAHTDTVDPHEGAPYDMFEAQAADGMIWGLGSTDMKSGVAAMIQALKLTPDADNIWLFLYADEELYFLGMENLVKEFSNICPKVLVSSDGSDLKFGYGCRGCIEFRMRVFGESGHPARGTGNSAIWGSTKALIELEEYLAQFTHPVMGRTSFNVAHHFGGATLTGGKSFSGDELVAVGQKGNVVPDINEFVVDIRPATPDLTLDEVLKFLEDKLTSRGLKFKVIDRTHDLGAWYTDPGSLKRYTQIAMQVTGSQQVEMDDPKGSGYIDMQMLWQTVGRPDAFMFGGGFGDTAHTPNEHIAIANLITERNFFQKVLEDYLLS